MHRRLPWLLVLLALLVVLSVHAYVLSFQCDDAYISYRYARNFKDGLGLVFNPGEYVEGYTNFSWTILLGVTWWLTSLSPDITSIFFSGSATLGVAGLIVWLARHPTHERADLASALALAFFVTNRTAAVWTTSGLETRMFTLTLLAALVASRGKTLRAAVTTSALLGLAELTRPEALLYGPLILGWTTVKQINGYGWKPREVAARWLPFLGIVAGHFAFRLWYYGAWLPNTFAAKGHEVWFEAGGYYLASAGVEYGLFLLLPVAVVGAVWRWWARGDDLLVMGGILVACHLVFVARVGGDHFEFRMLDFAFTLLALALAEGVLALTHRLRGLARLSMAPLMATLLFYQCVIPWMDFQATKGFTERKSAFHVDLTAEHAPWASRMPFVGWMAESYNTLHTWTAIRMVGTRMIEHRNFRDRQVNRFSRYDPDTRRALPSGLVTTDGVIGVIPYYLSDLTFVDKVGLTDAVVPTLPELDRPIRQLAHTKRDVDAYLDSRRNIHVQRHEPTAAEALKRERFAVKLAEGVWMPFDRGPERFEGYEVTSAIPIDPDIPMLLRGKEWEVVRIVEPFEGKTHWTPSGTAFTAPITGKARAYQRVLLDVVGEGTLNSFHPRHRDKATGTLRSPEIRLEKDETFAMLVGGGASKQVGVRVFLDGRPAGSVRGRDRERMRIEFLARGPGTAVLEVYDDATEAWGHILVDQVAILRPRKP